MNKRQLIDEVAIPLLKKIPLGYTASSVLASEMIIAHESKRGEYIRQLRQGPALGMIQMEPATHDDVWKHGDTVWCNAVDVGIITRDQFNNQEHPPAERLIYDLQYNIFMVRQRLFMKPEALPHTPEQMSAYLKEHWNSVAGAASNMSYYDDWVLWR